jgi:rhodanese-related sulfurtransferase
MNPLTLVLVALVAWIAIKMIGARGGLAPAEAARLHETGEAVIIDVREPGEWANGVAGPALLLSLSDLRNSSTNWRNAIEENRGKKFLVYCASGMRSSMAARQLKGQGLDAVNLGGFGRWHSAGLPTRRPTKSELRSQ